MALGVSTWGRKQEGREGDAHGTPYAPGPSCLSTWAALPPKSSVCLDGSLQIDQMFAAFPPDVTGNLDYKNLVHIITHGEEKD